MTVSAERATTSPSALTTSSGLSAPAAAWASAASGWKTSWRIPERSRRSMKTTPPWSRRRWTQPATRTRSPSAPAALGAGVGAVARRADHAPQGLGQLAQRAPRAARRSSMSLTVATPASCSRGPTMTACRAPRLAAWRIMPFRLRPRRSPLAAQARARAAAPAAPAPRRAAPASAHRQVAVERRGLLAGASPSIASTIRSMPAPKPMPGVGRPAEGLDQAVVAAAAADGALGAEAVAGELEDRHRVVVEAAHQGRVLLVGDPEAGRGPSSTRSRCASAAGERWSSSVGAPRHDLGDARVLGVEQAQRVVAHARAGVLVEGARGAPRGTRPAAAGRGRGSRRRPCSPPAAAGRAPPAGAGSRRAARSPRRRAAGRRCRSPRRRTASARGSGPPAGAS